MTPRQKDVLDYIRKNPHCSVEEIRVGCGFSSKSNVHSKLLALRQQGYIEWLPNHARSIMLIEKCPFVIRQKAMNDCYLSLKGRTDCLKASNIIKGLITRDQLKNEQHD